eukprot:scaffold7596_cov113-Isochrysis_galbana.AAC.3
MNMRPRATRLLARSLHSALLALCLSTARAPALGIGCECSKDLFGSRSTPRYYHSKRLSTTTPSPGFFKIQQNSTDSFVKNQNPTFLLTTDSEQFILFFLLWGCGLRLDRCRSMWV